LSTSTNVAVIGLGYVGLPLAVALARKFNTYGLDVDKARVAELQSCEDRTGEVDREVLAASSLKVTTNTADIPPSDFYIITVPTPIDDANRPDLSVVEAASRTVGQMLGSALQGGSTPIVIYESTVYPGVTEDTCVPILEEMSGLVWKRDFFVGYSPERINPGDREHTVDKITKVVSGDTPETLRRVSQLYGAVTTGGTFEAASIRAAEAAKVIENAQRDINIAFMNEIAQIFSRMGLSVWDVLSAARTKWNFLPFSPGLVGGHCIGVDPYYLSYRASELGHDPRVILAGRAINDGMADWIADQLHRARGGVPGSVLVLGLTFKEDVPDLRNSKVADLIAGLARRGHRVTVHDPLADPGEARREYELELDREALAGSYDVVLLAVPHRAYIDMGVDRLRANVAPGGLLADLKDALSGKADWKL
jgi:UDP-N-acetyl-D-glucosamine/UDP-N-acetyl-D-galactosamine dehydrogenase